MNKQDKARLIDALKRLPGNLLSALLFVCIVLLAISACLQDHQGKIAQATLDMAYCTWFTVVLISWEFVRRLNRKDKP